MISTAHKDGTINKDSNKPEIVMNYNSTKGGVDTIDQMTQNMCCNRKTKRWPLCFFYNMLNISTLNSFVIYTHNNYKIKLRPLNRLRYMLKLRDELIAPWLKIRYALPNINSDLRLSIGKLLNQPVETAPNPSQKGSRTQSYILQLHKEKNDYNILCKTRLLEADLWGTSKENVFPMYIVTILFFVQNVSFLKIYFIVLFF